MFEPIAIVGMAMRLPGQVRTGKEFWEMLVQKRNGLCKVPQDRYNIDGFYSEHDTPGTIRQPFGYFLEDVQIQQLDTSFFSFPKKELERLDPQQRQLLEVAWECMENAGSTNWRGSNIGCFVGALGEDWRDLNSKETQQGGSYRVTGYEDAFLANRLSYEYNLHGPSMTVKTACSSSLFALHLACDSIRLGDCSSALVAGSSLIFSPSMTLAFSDQGIVSPTGTCKTFDASADGYARGEAINMIYIKKLSDAVEAGDPVRAVIRATAANSDGKTTGVMNPSPEAQETLIRRAYDVAGIKDFSQTAFVECHGTGTQAGDPLETIAVAKVKPNVGHSEGAAGISSVIKAVLALENRTIPPNIFFHQPNPKIPFKEASLRVPVEAEPWPLDRSARVSVNSFGIGGANAHVIIDGWGKRGLAQTRLAEDIVPHDGQYHLLIFSANSKESVEASVVKHRNYMKETSVRLNDLSYTLAARREHLAYRTFAVTDNVSTWDAAPAELTGPTPKIVYIFTGQGAQWPEMGRKLLQVNLTFRQTIRKLDQALKTVASPLIWTIEEELCKPASESKIHTAELAQPLCTAIQIALVEALRAWRVEPDAVLGHSSGEIAAAYACGAITMEESMAIACFRGATAHKARRVGGMAAIGLGSEDVSKFLKSGVVIACENSQSSTTLSGDLERVEEVLSKIKEECPDVLARMLQVEKAYHSHHMLDVGPAYQEQLTAVVKSAAPKIAFYSSVTTGRISHSGALGPTYWRENLESPVLFNPALRVLRSELDGKIVFIEIGPHPALKAPVKQILREVGQANDIHLSTLARGTACQQSLLNLAGNLFANNCMLDLPEVSPPGAVLTDLPNYSWIHDTKHWDEPRLTREWRFRTQPPHELLGTRLVELCDEPIWRNKLALDNLPWLHGHQVAGQIVFPAAGYVAMVGEAIRQLSANEAYSLKNVKISAALVLEHGTSVETVTTFTSLLAGSPEDSPWYVFQISSYNGNGWTRHCSGEARSSFDASSYPRILEPTLSLPRKVSSRSWYDTMKEVGFCYEGVFRGLQSISAGTTKNEAVAVATNPAMSHGIPYKLHPAVIDQCFQLLCIAALKGQMRQCRRLSVPTYIEEIMIFSTATDLRVEASGSISERGAFSGNVLAGGDGKISMFMKGLSSTPLDTGDILDQGLRSVQQIEWKADSDFMPLEECFQFKRRLQNECLLVELLFLLCIADHLDQLKMTEDTPNHLRTFFAWMKMQVSLLLSGKRNLVEKGQVLNDSSRRLAQIKSIAAEIKKTELADCAIAIMRLFEAAEDIFAGRAQPLDLLMEGNLLSRLYDILDSGDYCMAINALGFKKPRSSILEIGAGTGGTSAKILEALRSSSGERMYSKYTYTDISPGFMAAAKERFHQYENIEYKVLDISKDPSEQGFDLGAYDLIIGANVVHATPSLHTSLKHLRSLLRPGGRIFLQELSPETKWVNYIWGYLSGWWLGVDDGREDQPYVSPARWSQELVCAGFNPPDTIVYDALPPHYLNACIIASAASETRKVQRVTLLCVSPDEAHVKAVKLQLEADDIEVDICLLSQDAPMGQDVICLLDMPTPILHEMSKMTFDTIIRHLLSVKANIFWVTWAAQINCIDPRSALILGLARSARNEQAAKIYTIELDKKTSISMAADRIAAIQTRVQKASCEDMIPDWEYAVVDGVINVPRMQWQTMAASMAKCADETIRITQRLSVGTPGLLHTMQWREEPLLELQDNDVCVQIKSVGMNFKDVLIAMGILDNDVAEIGLEASGIVQARGQAVKNLDIGDRVAFMCPGSFIATRILPGALCVKLDPTIGFEEGATIPCVYVTAMMALVDKGKLEKGQSVLIHSACGGVGLAAIQIAKSIGAEIFCTVGNPEKVEYLVKNYGIPERHIFNSRDATFVTDVMRVTDDRGVDLVLNSLAGELLHASWKCVAEFGTMVEIGKRDFRRRARLAMEVFEANRNFVGLDLGLVHQKRPEQAVSLLQRCMTYIQSGVTRPLPLAKVFEASAVQDAFRFMQGGNHIGKIVVNMPTDPKPLASVTAPPKTRFRSDRSYLLVGGLGGLGKVVASWMAENGAHHLIFLSRSGDTHEDTRDFLDELYSQGCQSHVIAGSVSNKVDVEAAVRGASVPIAGVINMSMVLEDVSLSDMTFENWTTATEPKVQGTQNLHEAVSSPLDFFILFGSCSGIAGQWGQANYGAANTFVDAFVQYRHSQGLPASVVDLGAVGGAGFVAENHDILTYMQNSGTHLLQEQDVLDAVVLAIHRSHPSTQHQPSSPGFVDTSQIILGILTTRPIADSRTLVPWKTDPRMSFYHNMHGATDISIDASAEQEGLKSVLALVTSTPEILTEPSSRETIAVALSSALFSFLLKSEEDTRLDRSLDSIGVDSLVAMELRNWIRQKLTVEITTFNIIHSSSLRALAELVANALMVRLQGPRWHETSGSKPSSKLYRTGDLVSYNTDATVNYINRIDNQVKIRGQRTELAEIEHQLRRILANITAAVVEVVELEGSPFRKTLVAFLCFNGEGKEDGDQLAHNEIDPQTASELATLSESLADSLPVHMIPSYYVPFRSFPLTSSGETDRRKLCLCASKLSLQDLNAYTSLTTPGKQVPCTSMEILLQNHWASTLNIEVNAIGRDDNFFKLGGDSIMAIRLVTTLRNDRWSLAIISVFQTPILCDMARTITSVDANLGDDPDPFSLLGDKKIASIVQQEVLSQCETFDEAVEDIYPCTPLQEGLVALSIKRPGSYIAQFVMNLAAADIDLNRFRAAWERVFERAPVLRTRICDTKSNGLVQVVLKESIEWFSGDDLDLYLSHDRKINMTLGRPLARSAIISGPKMRHFVLTLHHALYDAWTIRLVLRNVNRLYAGQAMSHITQFSRYIRHITEIDQSLGISGEEFWRSQLVNASPSEFPALPSTCYEPELDSILTQGFSLPARQSGSCTMSTLIWAAWALVVSRYTDSLDVVFGTILSGRYAPIANIEDIMGPTINTVPIRHKIDLSQSVNEFLENFQTQVTAMIPFEAIGLQHIQRFSNDCYAACQFRSLIAVQPPTMDEDMEGAAKIVDTGGEKDFASYPLTMDCTLMEAQIQVTAAYDSKVIDQRQMVFIMHQFKHAITQLCSESHTLVVNLKLLSPEDHQEIFQWQNRTFSLEDKYIDEIFRESVLLHPKATAVHAWDGQLTYYELDRLSTSLACKLVQLGVAPEVTVPLCFDRSMWAVVAMIATLKAGGAFVPMDPLTPLVRLKSMITQTQSRLVLCSAKYSEWFDSFCENTVVVGGDLVVQTNLGYPMESKRRSPHDAAYIIFTSGSTGDPKGCVITHQAYCTGLTAYAKEIVNSNTRSLQFASYSFDACILEIVTPLAAGGCVCIPSDQKRLDDLAGAISEMAINWAALTPSTARLLDPKDVPTLKTLLIGGEALSKDDVPRWRGRAELFHMYGPTECAVIASRFAGLTDSTHPNNIGVPYASNFWIVDPSNHDLLVPVGSVGELLIDGPILARGYLHDPVKTAASFIENPRWLSSEQRPRRMYKTGDLVRYNSDGTMNFVDRKDTQIKLRGQRIQLDEVEYHLHEAFPSVDRFVAELVQVERNTLLVAFLSIKDISVQGENMRNRHQADKDLFKVDATVRNTLALMLSESEVGLTNAMPAYMIPSAYIPIQYIPSTVAGKTDRGRLRRFVSAMSTEDLNTYRIQKKEVRVEPSTLMEREFQALWAMILGLDAEKVGAQDNFFKLGGDSITAIRLVGACRAKGLLISATDVFRHPRLRDIAVVASTAQDELHDEVVPYSLFGTPSTIYRIRMHAVAQCGITEDLLEDIYPCTALQEGLMAISTKKPGAYMAQGAIELSKDVDIDHFQKAWEMTVEFNPILRTRIIEGSSESDHGTATGFMQVVVKGSVPWHYGNSLSEYFQLNRSTNMGFGKALTRYAMIRDKGSGHLHFVWTIHHALYDAWSISLVLKSVNEAYKGETVKKPIGFNTFIKYLLEKGGNQASEAYWRSSLQDAAPSVFPPHQSTAREPQPDSTLHHLINVPERRNSSANFTISTMLRAAWAVLISRYTDSQDVIFGAIITGRTAPMYGIEEMPGPTINTVPVRVVLQPRITVQEYLQQIQDQSTEMIPFETLGLQRIQHLSENARAACQFQNLLLVQPAPTDNAGLICSIQMTAAGELFDNLSTYALAMQCSLGKQGIDVAAGYDSNVISRKQMQRVMYQFDHLIQQIFLASESLLVEELNAVSFDDQQEIVEWSGGPIQSATSCLDEMFEVSVSQNCERSAINAWDGNFTYDELNEEANRLAQHLIDAGVGPESKVPLCFHKSRWAVVAMLGAVKAGGAIVPMDPAHPRTRLEFVIKAVEAEVVLCSSDQAQWLSECCQKVIVVDSSLERHPVVNSSAIQRRTSLSSALYIVFTSGSTGEPKGCIIEHRAFCSSVLHHAKGARFGPTMRDLQLASYSFGAATAEIFSTLLHGGCICIVPNEARANVIRVIKEMDVNFMFMSPTFARLLPPQAMPTLKTLVLGSEVMSIADLEKWTPHVKVVQGYGQTECSTIAATYSDMMPDINPRNVGYPMAARFWIVDASNHDILAPLGAVGELLIEGPILARGYLNEPAKTAAVFIKPPIWRKDFPLENCERLYKTGDLARFHDDGTLIFMGRKDNQVKLRGQRVELGEIEHQLRHFIPDAKEVVVEMIQILVTENQSRSFLVAFVCLDDGIVGNDELDAKDPKLIEALLPLISGLAPQLSEVLPSYMIPAAYLPLRTLPKTTSGKIDRKRLRELASALSIKELASYSLFNMARREPSTTAEKRLQRLWAHVIGIDIDSISADDNFFQLGGDSISAIKLVSVCRSEGMSMSVAEIFKNPFLWKMAEVLQTSAMTSTQYMPFSSIDNSAKEEIVRKILSGEIVDNEDDIEDVLETTYMQSSFVACGLMEQRSKTNYISFIFPAPVDAARLEVACRILVTRHRILRTIFIPHQQQLLQVVLRSFPGDFKHYQCESDWESFASNIIDADSTERAALGKSFVRFMLFDGGIHGFRLTLRINHAQFDGMSFPMMIEDLAAAYQEREHVSHWPRFSDFIYNAREVHGNGAITYYRGLLDGSTMTEVASQTKPCGYCDPVNKVITRQMPHVSFSEHGITFPTVMKAAWSMVLAEMTGKADVVFGYLVSGRNLPMPNIDEVIGPCINITPIRVHHQKTSALNLLQQIQDQNLEGIPYENFSFEKIVAECTAWPRRTRCSTIVQCQHVAIEPGTIAFGDLECHLTATNPPSDLADLIIDAGPPSGSKGKGTTVSFLFSTKRISYDVVDEMANLLSFYITRIATDINMILPLPSEHTPSSSLSSRVSIPNHPHTTSQTSITPSASQENQNQNQNQAKIINEPPIIKLKPLIQKVWTQVLGHPSPSQSININDQTPFYDIWGHPIAAAALVQCYAEEGVEVTMEDIIRHPSMRLQGEFLGRKGGGGE